MALRMKPQKTSIIRAFKMDREPAFLKYSTAFDLSASQRRISKAMGHQAAEFCLGANLHVWRKWGGGANFRMDVSLIKLFPSFDW